MCVCVCVSIESCSLFLVNHIEDTLKGMLCNLKQMGDVFLPGESFTAKCYETG